MKNIKQEVNTNKKIYKTPIALISALIVVLICIIVYFIGVNNKENMYLSKYKEAILQEKYIAHALGGIGEEKYTNSKEALENSYNSGMKFFEIDTRMSSDGKLICVHGWSKKDYKEKLGMKYDKENPVMSYENFMNAKIKEKYTTIDFKTFLEFFETHKDMYAMMDIGNQNYEDTKKIYEKIVEECNNNLDILNRLIVGGHTTDMIKAVKETFEFKIINLYWAPKSSRTDEKIDTKEEFLKYCKEEGISSLSTSTGTYNDEKDIIKYFKDNGLIVYVFTENDQEKANQLLENADLVGTDFINIKD